jgi:hypothetical protein
MFWVSIMPRCGDRLGEPRAVAIVKSMTEHPAEF